MLLNIYRISSYISNNSETGELKINIFPAATFISLAIDQQIQALGFYKANKYLHDKYLHELTRISNTNLNLSLTCDLVSGTDCDAIFYTRNIFDIYFCIFICKYIYQKFVMNIITCS